MGDRGVGHQIELAAQSIPVIIGIRVVGSQNRVLVRQFQKGCNGIEDTESRIQKADPFPSLEKRVEDLQLVPLGQLAKMAIVRHGLNGVLFKCPDEVVRL